MPRIDETSYGAHGFTVDWWRELPEAFRVADRVQGETLAPAWDGLNRDPRFVTGFDGWDRANTSTEPWVVSFTMTRTFTVTPNVPVLVRSWHTPAANSTGITAYETTPGVYEVSGAKTTEDQPGVFTIDGAQVTEVAPGVFTIDGATDPVSVHHTIRDYTGNVVADKTSIVVGEQNLVDTWVTPDRFGTIHVSISVAIPAPTGADILNAIHVGTRDVAFDELPDMASFTVNKPYPLLRFMDGVGHQAGFLDDQLAHMWDGDTFDPVTAPEQWLRFLGTIMGLPRTYMGRLTLPQLRSHLVAFTENGRPPIGSRRNIAEVAKQWLTGDKQVSVIPATQLPTWSGGEDKALLTAVKGASSSGKVIVSPTAPIPDVEYQWTGARGVSASVQLTNGDKTAENLENNPRFEKDLAGWSIARGSMKRDTTVYQTGGGSAGILPSADAGAGWYFIADARAYQQTTTVTTTMWVYSQVRRSVAVGVFGYNGAAKVQGNTVSLTPNTWTPVTATYPVTPTHTYRPALGPAAGDTTAGALWVDRVYTARTEYDYGNYFDGDNQDSSANDLWVKPGSPNTVYVWDQQARWVQKTGVTQGLIDAVVDAKRGARSVYTLLMFVRADELPNRDLKAFQQFMQDSGVIPAGHRLVCLESRPTWDQWENAVGPTWTDLESRTKTWTDSESAGVNLDF